MPRPLSQKKESWHNGPMSRSRLFKPWACLCAGGTLGMVLLGGLTRLTESGLSIAEWQLFQGIVPPLNDRGWMDLFALYQHTPEFIQKNSSMDLAAFKGIFWLEYIHRLWGRCLGLWMILPGFFWITRSSLESRKRRAIALMMGLVVLQGGVGWVMVQSGLTEEPRVSPYRLCLHLVLALILYLLSLDLFQSQTPHRLQGKRPKISTRSVHLLLGLFGMTLCFGAFVAGLDAGLVYNTFPTMDGAWFPDRMFFLEPAWCNVFENPGTVQWVHRCLGVGSFGGMLLVVVPRLGTLDMKERRFLYSIMGLGCAQVLLGVWVLLHQVPLWGAVMHQITAFLLIGQLWMWRKHLKAPLAFH